MNSIHDLSVVSDDDLLRRLAALLVDSRHTEADLVAHIAEADARRLYAREATPSMFQYCTERLHLSGAEAYLRIAAGRAAREHPILLAMLADGRLHLTAIALLAPHLTLENRDVLLARATQRTKREIEGLLAEVAPRPDAPAMIRKLPEGGTPGPLLARSSAGPSLATESTATALSAGRSTPAERAEQSSAEPSPAPAWTPGSCLPVAQPTAPPPDSLASTSSDSGVERPGSPTPALRLDGVVSSRLPGVVATPATIQPLSPSRYKIQFTASAELRDKLERLQDLMRSSVPDGDLAAIIDAAVTEKVERLEARRFGRTERPRKTLSETDTAPRTRRVPAAVRRTVDARDEGRCAYVDEQGRRCPARVGLELHHRRTFATGGDHSPANVSLLCRGHNRYLAEIDYGREAMARHDGPSSSRSSQAATTQPVREGMENARWHPLERVEVGALPRQALL